MDWLIRLLIWLFRFYWRALLSIKQIPLKRAVAYYMRKAGIRINGPNAWDMVVKDERAYKRIAYDGSLGLGETYVEGWWDCEDLEEFWYRYLRVNPYIPTNDRVLHSLGFSLINQQTKSKSLAVVEEHYDLGNDLFQSFLDPTMAYSCGYWRNAENIEEAQLAKLDLIARKLKLEPGMTVADIGCGWGSLAKHLAKNYGVKVVGCTISKEQVAFATDVCAGLPVEIRLMDYRDLDGKFDRIVNVGFFEHVGKKNYRPFFELCHRCLTDDGIFLLHTIGMEHKDVIPTDLWMNKYIFPGGILPYDYEILKYTEGLFILEDWHNFGMDYNKTLRAWYKRFVDNWSKLQPKYGDKFFRIWSYYLLTCAGFFRSRKLHVWQIVFSKNGLENGYLSER